jgi:carboxymethylenebutenolidase
VPTSGNGEDREERGAGMSDIGAVFDEHIKAEFVTKDLDATMATMTEDPFLVHVPVMTGGRGRDEVARFYRDHFIPAWPDDVAVEHVSRTAGADRLIDELLVRFTHTRMMDFMTPGVAPTGRRVELPHVVVVGFEGDKISYEHIYWDQASLLVQLGLLDPGSWPVTGAEQVRSLTDRSTPMNALMNRGG